MLVVEAEVEIQGHPADLRGGEGGIGLLVVLGIGVQLQLGAIERLVDQPDLQTATEHTPEELVLVGILRPHMGVLKEANRLGEEHHAHAMLGLAQGERHIGRDEERLGCPMHADPFQASQSEDIQV